MPVLLRRAIFNGGNISAHQKVMNVNFDIYE
jgi:hypothetical protein